jgi:hypothetical protein
MFTIITLCAIKKPNSGREVGKNGKAAERIQLFDLPISYRPYRLTGISTNTHILFNEFNTQLKF